MADYTLLHTGAQLDAAIANHVNTSDANLIAGAALQGYSGYANKVKINGNISSKSSQTYTPSTTDQTITAGQYLSGDQVISGDADLVAGNIKKDVSIFGVTGTYEGSGGSTTGDYRVRFIDYDGTILKEAWADSGGSVTAPSDPSHTGLTFQGWNYAASAYGNITSDLDIGAMYTTSDGKSVLLVRLNAATGLAPTLYFNKSTTFTLSIDWGDGNADTNTASGNINVSHTYAADGDYSIKVWISSGTGTYTFGNGSTSTTVVGGSTQAYRSSLISVNIGDNVASIGNRAFYYCCALTTISIPSGVTSIGSSAFQYCYTLAFILIPDGVTSIGSSIFYYCYALESVSIPSGVTSIGQYAFQYCFALESVTIPNDVTSISANAFTSCYTLASILIPNGVTSITNSMIAGCYLLASIVIPSGVTSIGTYSFQNCYGVKKYIINATTPPTLTDTTAFGGIISSTRIYVPDASVSTYKAATNWSTYANYIYPISEME